MVDNTIEIALGSQFFEKLKVARATKKQKRFVWTPENKKELLMNLRASLEGAIAKTNTLRYKFRFSGVDYDVMLLKTMPEVRIKNGKFGVGVSMRSGVDFRDWITCWMTEVQFNTIAPEQEYIVIGKWKEKLWNEKMYENFSVNELVALAEVNLELEKLASPTTPNQVV